jgi:hypothetical protein
MADTPTTQAASVDAEALIRACVPGGSSCDPQAVADSIRAFLASTSAAPSDSNAVYVKLTRPEGYEDVHPELVLADANIKPDFEPEVVALSSAAPSGDSAGVPSDTELARRAYRYMVAEHLSKFGEAGLRSSITSGDYPVLTDLHKRFGDPLAALSAASSSAPAEPQQQARLTDERIDQLWNECRNRPALHFDVRKFARLIESEAASLHAGDAAGQAHPDTVRLDWLERQIVEVRVRMRYGSQRVIYEIPEWDEEQDEQAPSDLRAAIDAARSATPAALSTTEQGQKQ